MKLPTAHPAVLPGLVCTALALLLFVPALLGGAAATTLGLIAVSIAMFHAAWASANRVLGPVAALRWVAIAVALGWLAEELGASFGWFFGRYHYTEVLGPRIGSVPAVIPLMWFVLCYTAHVIASLIVWQRPTDSGGGLGNTLTLSLLAATIVTAYDLGADPYMVFVLKAWIMVKTDGWWFGETLQGFVGWMTVSFAIVFASRLATRDMGQATRPGTGSVLIPLGIYCFSLLFQASQGYPVETRTIAVFAMGIPLLCAACGLARWRRETATAETAGAAPAAAAELRKAA